MKVLWFSGVQLPAVTGQDLNRAGWQEGLRRELNRYFPEIKLGIASFGAENLQTITIENTTYFNIHREPQPEIKWRRLLNNWRHHQVKQEELDRCLDIVREFNPDLIFIFGTENPFGLLVDQFPVPAIISLQAILNGVKERVFWGLPPRDIFSELFSKKFIYGKGLIHKWWKMNQQAKVEKKIFQRCKYFDGRTDWDRGWLKELNPKAKYFHIDRVLGELYYDACWNPDLSKGKCVYTTSSSASFKGGVTLVRAFVKLNKQGREDIQLRMAGIHPQSRVGKTIQRLINQNDMHKQINLLGRIPPEQVKIELEKASIFVLPSHMDNSPNSLAEAMMVGVPCIASDAGGIPSMLEHEVEGFIYPHQSIAGLAENIEKLIDDRDLAINFGQNARRTAMSRHDPKRIAQITVDMYHQVLSEN